MSGPRPYLAVFRAGPGSVHRRLLDEGRARNWDCAVNAWAGAAVMPEPRAEEFIFRGGEN
jgi:hypothetical protein